MKKTSLNSIFLWNKIASMCVPSLLVIAFCSFSLSLFSLNDDKILKPFAIPMYFEKNEGQTDCSVEYLTRGPGYIFYFTPQQIVMDLQNTSHQSNTVLKMQFIGASQHPIVKGNDEQLKKSNYFIGQDTTKWRTNISNYGKVVYKEVYPGIDALFYGNDHQIEYDICVQPGANPQDIHLHIEGADKLLINNQGDLCILAENGAEMQMKCPVIYQIIEEKKISIEGKFELLAQMDIGFKVATYDETQPLIIDPVLVYSTYLGGSGPGRERGLSIVSDANGYAYVTGFTNSTNFPTTVGAYEQTYSGGVSDLFITKFDQSGSNIVYSTYVGGGTGETQGEGIVVDIFGNAYVTGQTSATDFPVTTGTIQTTYGGGDYDAFVLKLNPSGGDLLYSTYLGGSSTDVGRAIAVDRHQYAYVSGSTNSANFPVTGGAYNEAFATGSGNMAFIAKINLDGSALVYSTYLGGSLNSRVNAIAIDPFGSAYVTGQTQSTDFPVTSGVVQPAYAGGDFDAFVTKLNPEGTSLVYSTHLGGSLLDQAEAIVIDQAGNAYVGGLTQSTDFPTTADAFQTTPGGGSDCGFITKLNQTATEFIYSTYLGGSSDSQVFSLRVDRAGYVYVTGDTAGDFPLVNPFQSTYGGGSSDAYISKLAPDGSSLVFSTYFGGTEQDRGLSIALDAIGNAYFTGFTASSETQGFPLTDGAFQTIYQGGQSEAFIAKFAIGTPIIKEIIPHNGLETAEQIVTIKGVNFTAATAVNFGENSAFFKVVSDTEITAVSPQGKGIVYVTVTSLYGTSLFSALQTYAYDPLSPVNLKGFQKVIKYKNPTTVVNILHWEAPNGVSTILAYKIYRDEDLTDQIGFISADQPLRFVDDLIGQGKIYTYFVVSVNEFGMNSAPAKIAIKPKNIRNRSPFNHCNGPCKRKCI